MTRCFQDTCAGSDFVGLTGVYPGVDHGRTGSLPAGYTSTGTRKAKNKMEEVDGRFRTSILSDILKEREESDESI